MRQTGASNVEVSTVCLTCGCMDAHQTMGKANITYEDIKRAAAENGQSVSETLDIMDRTELKDRGQHPQEYDVPVEAPRLTSTTGPFPDRGAAQAPRSAYTGTDTTTTGSTGGEGR